MLKKSLAGNTIISTTRSSSGCGQNINFHSYPKEKTNVKLELKTRSLGHIARLREFVEQQLRDLRQELAITSAQVTLEQDTGRAPAFRATALLMVPGPDLRAAGCDHTLLAAWLKVTNELKRQIRARKTRRMIRLKSNLRVRDGSTKCA